MNIKDLQLIFLEEYPNGFDTEEMKIIAKKHNVDGIADFVSKGFIKENFEDTALIIDLLRKLMNKSTLVSRFEKAPFKSFINDLDMKKSQDIKQALYEIYHGDEKKGFESMIGILQVYKLAKWPIISLLFAYRDPQVEVFVKPTTAKNILKTLESDLVYNSHPTYEFYKAYRTYINDLKEDVNKSLAPNNPAFTGFLMLAIGML